MSRARLSLSLAAALLTGVASAAPHHAVLETPQPTSVGPQQVEVLEFFSWGCPHCFHTEPLVQAFLQDKPANVVFKRVPATFEPSFAKLAPAYYVAEMLGVVDQVSAPIFAALHDPAHAAELRDPLMAYRRAEIQRAGLDAPQRAYVAAMATLFQRHAGVDEAKFRAAWFSPTVRVKLAESEALYKAYKIHSVPAFAIDGRFVAQADEALEIKNGADTVSAMRAAVAEAMRARR